MGLGDVNAALVVEGDRGGRGEFLALVGGLDFQQAVDAGY